MEKKINLMVLFGGASSEHEVSCVSAASVLRHIDRQKYDVTTVGITRNGRWLITEADSHEIEKGLWEGLETNRNITLVPGEGFQEVETDIVFPILHGRNGEDGRMQGFLDIAGIPYVGSGSTSSAACMDKALTKAVVDQAEVCHQAECCIAHRGCDIDEAVREITAYFEGEFPLFVKPANAGSSVGISKAKSPEDLKKGLEVAFKEDSKAIVEEAIIGREIEVAVLGNSYGGEEDAPVASCIGEIFPANEFYDYKAKYDNIGSRTGVVRDLSQEREEFIRDTAVAIYKIMGCEGLARVDFFLEADGEGSYDSGRLVFNEINTLPGFTSISMYPQLWEEKGIPYENLIDRLIQLGLKK